MKRKKFKVLKAMILPFKVANTNILDIIIVHVGKTK